MSEIKASYRYRMRTVRGWMRLLFLHVILPSATAAASYACLRVVDAPAWAALTVGAVLFTLLQAFAVFAVHTDWMAADVTEPCPFHGRLPEHVGDGYACRQNDCPLGYAVDDADWQERVETFREYADKPCEVCGKSVAITVGEESTTFSCDCLTVRAEWFWQAHERYEVDMLSKIIDADLKQTIEPETANRKDEDDD